MRWPYIDLRVPATLIITLVACILVVYGIVVLVRLIYSRIEVIRYTGYVRKEMSDGMEMMRATMMIQHTRKVLQELYDRGVQLPQDVVNLYYLESVEDLESLSDDEVGDDRSDSGG